MVRRGIVFGTLAATLLCGCEVALGIHDKTLAVDASVPVESGSPTDPSAACSQQPAFLYCNDFDSSSLPGDTWDWSDVTGGGSLAFDAIDYRSAPRSMQFVAPFTAPMSQAQLGKDIVGLTSSITLAFDLRLDVDALDQIPQVGIAQIFRADGVKEYDYMIGPGSATVFQISTTNAPTKTIAMPVPPLRAWMRITLSYDKTGGVTVYENGQVVGSDASLAAGPPGTMKIIIGNVFTNPQGKTQLQFQLDNVVVRGQ